MMRSFWFAICVLVGIVLWSMAFGKPGFFLWWWALAGTMIIGHGIQSLVKD